MATTAAAALPHHHPAARRGQQRVTAPVDPWITTRMQSENPDMTATRTLQQEEQNNNAGFDNGQAGRLRRDLLLNYDRGAFPWEYAWSLSTGGNRTGLEVEVGINFHRVFSVDVKSSVADLIVWFRQRWTDPRLAWDPLLYNNLTNVWFWIQDGIGSGETSEIWTPDLKLWNSESSLSDTLTDSYATVDAFGTVFWSRPGHLRPACKFDGLDSFPFDSLTCRMEFGSWSYSGLYLRPIKMDEGFTIGGSDTAGESFAEFRLKDENAISCRQHVYPPYPSLPEEDWPVLLYDVSFHRSWQPYVRGYVLMQVILNFCGFGSFWLPVQSGERMGLAITAMLAAVASELVVAASLPTASEMTWFQSFSLFSLSFAAFALFESIAVIYFFYYTGSDLIPKWWRWLERALCGKCSTSGNFKRKKQNEYETEHDESSDSNEAVKDTTHATPDDDMIPTNSCEKASVLLDMPPPPSEQLKDKDRNDARVPHFEQEPDESTPRFVATNRPSLVMASSQRGFDADDFRDKQEAENNQKWQMVSKTIDEVCRVAIPVLYVIVLAILLRRVEYD